MKIKPFRRILLIFVILSTYLVSCQYYNLEPSISDEEQAKINYIFRVEVNKRVQANPNANLNDLSLKGVTSLEGLFKGKNFTGDISKWNVSKVKNFKSMFEGTSFNGDIGSWKLNSAENMQFMFKDNEVFNQNLSSWEINEDKTLFASIFKGAKLMLGDFDTDRNSYAGSNNMPPTIRARYNKMKKPADGTIGALKTLIEKEMQDKGASADTANYNYIDTSETVSFHALFDSKKTFNGKINDWDTSNVTIMQSVFYNAESFNIDISEWNTSNVTTMQAMFYNAKIFNKEIGKWETSNVVHFTTMFAGAVSFNQKIGSWNTSKANWMGKMFANATSFNQEIGKWDVGAVKSTASMFKNATSFNQDIGNWNLINLEGMDSMFENAKSFNQDLNAWDEKLNNATLLSFFDSQGLYVKNIFDGASAMKESNKPEKLRNKV